MAGGFVIHQGPVLLKSGIQRKWKENWGELRDNGRFVVLPSASSTKALVTIDLPTAKRAGKSIHEPAPEDHAIDIVTREHTWSFACHNEGHRVAWLRSLLPFVNEHAQRKARARAELMGHHKGAAEPAPAEGRSRSSTESHSRSRSALPSRSRRSIHAGSSSSKPSSRRHSRSRAAGAAALPPPPPSRPAPGAPSSPSGPSARLFGSLASAEPNGPPKQRSRAGSVMSAAFSSVSDAVSLSSEPVPQWNGGRQPGSPSFAARSASLASNQSFARASSSVALPPSWGVPDPSGFAGAPGPDFNRRASYAVGRPSRPLSGAIAETPGRPDAEPTIPPSLEHFIILEYLRKSGLTTTLSAFVAETGVSQASEFDGEFERRRLLDVLELPGKTSELPILSLVELKYQISSQKSG